MNPERDKDTTKSITPGKLTIFSVFKSVPTRLWKLLSHNLALKFLALFLAIGLWAVLITQDPNLTRERVFLDVPVTITGLDTLRRNALTIPVDFELEPLMVRLRADVPQREYNSVTAGNYNPRIDLSRITQTGDQTLKITTSTTTAYGEVKEIFPDSIEVIVEEYVTNYRVPVSIEFSGQYPTGYYGTTASLNPSLVSISGPKSIADRIARAIVDFNASSLPAQEGLTRTALPLRFIDGNGESVDSKFIDVTSAGVLLRSVIVEQTLYPTKTLPISSLVAITGKPETGYEIKSISATPGILVAAGDEIALNALDSLFLEHPVDINGLSETFTAEVDIRQPAELVYLSTKTAMLSIEIVPIISKREFEGIQLKMVDHTGKLTVHTDVKTISVTLTGPSLLLDKLKQSSLTAYVDISEMNAGEYELPISLDIQDVNEQAFSSEISPKLVKFQIEGT